MPRCCLVVLIGLPASGKTTLVHHIVADAAEDSQHLWRRWEGDLHVFPVVYDNVEGFESHEGFDPTRWHAGRAQAFAHVEERVRVAVSRGPSSLVVVDDNMYYRSMRRAFYRVAREYGIGLLQVYLNVDVEECVRRNRERVGSDVVLDSTIYGMAQRLEPPDAERFPWERRSLIVSSYDMNQPHWCICGRRLTVLWKAIGEAWENPVQAVDDNGEEADASRAIVRTSLLHQLDLALRTHISVAVCALQGAPARAETAAHLNTLRKALLDEVRQGRMDALLRGECGRASEETVGRDVAFLCHLFDERAKAIIHSWSDSHIVTPHRRDPGLAALCPRISASISRVPSTLQTD